MKFIVGLFVLVCLFFSCTPPKKDLVLSYKKTDFEKEVNGKKTSLYVLKNENGMVVTLTNYGAKIVSIFTPDRKGVFDDIILGCSNIDGYVKGNAGLGAVVGPYANRIANAQFVIDGHKYQLPVNNFSACLHSGPNGFYRQVFDAMEIQRPEGMAVEMSLTSMDGDCGFPGNKTLKVTYTLTKDNSLKIDYETTTDKACYFNITNHAYFNLKGEGKGDILDHVVTVDANFVTTVADSQMIPTGEIVDIRRTALDFTSPHVLGDRINDSMGILRMAHGYDHNYILNKDQTKEELTLAGTIYEPISGRFLECFTTEPAVQLYSGNSLKGDVLGKSGIYYASRSGVCLEAQHYPDSPHHPNFPSTLLKAGGTLRSTTVYRFSVKK